MSIRTVPRFAVVLGIAALLVLAVVDARAWAGGQGGGVGASGTPGRRVRLTGHLGWTAGEGSPIGHFEGVDDRDDDDDERKSVKRARVPIVLTPRDRVGLAVLDGRRLVSCRVPADPGRWCLRC